MQLKSNYILTSGNLADGEDKMLSGSVCQLLMYMFHSALENMVLEKTFFNDGLAGVQSVTMFL